MANRKRISKKETAPKNIKVTKTTSAKSKKNKAKLSRNPQEISVRNQKFYDQLKLNESYVSLILGAVVVIGVFAIFLIFLREARNTSPKPAVLNTSTTPEVTTTPQVTHTMAENETLWDVAVRYYGDGFRYTEIIEANKLENPDYVPPGTVIIIPNTSN